jgi:hypothetical protein
LVLLIGVFFFLVGLRYAPSGEGWDLTALRVTMIIILPWMATVLAPLVLRRLAPTPQLMFNAKRMVGSVFVAFCFWETVQAAKQATDVTCVQGTGGRDPECVEWAEVPGGDVEAVMLFMSIGGVVLWKMAALKEPQ